MTACVGASITENHALFDRVLTFGCFVNTINGRLRDTIVVAEVFVAFERRRTDFSRDCLEFFDESRRSAELEGLLDAV